MVALRIRNKAEIESKFEGPETPGELRQQRRRRWRASQKSHSTAAACAGRKPRADGRGTREGQARPGRVCRSHEGAHSLLGLSFSR